MPTAGEHKAPEIKPKTLLKGTFVGLGEADITIKAGLTAIARGKSDAQGQFEIELPKATDFFNLIAEGTKGALLQKALIAETPQSKTTDIGKIDLNSTTIALIIEAALSSKGLLPLNYPAEGIKILLKELQKQLTSTQAFADLKKMLEKLQKAAAKDSSSEPFLRSPRYSAPDAKGNYNVEASALNPKWLTQAHVDYCNAKSYEGCTDGEETTTKGFDQALAASIKAVSFPKCEAGEKLRLIFTVTIDPNAKDGNCATIKQFKHAKLHGGLSCDKCKVYFAGGIHKDSAINDPKLAQMLGNWEPNKIAMYDDGTHGDLIAGDGIWTLTFTVPAPIKSKKKCQSPHDCDKNEACLHNVCYKTLRLGYKYTYGLSGDIWGGTEEFPGNQRLLEVVDQNGDGFVARHDNFADETSNKDRVNTLQKKGATGMICFATPPKSACEHKRPRDNHPDCGCKTDQDGDGIPDTRERPWDQNNDCKPEGFKVFANVQPFVKSCR